MSGKERGALGAVVAAGGAGAIFLALWLGIGVPLAFSGIGAAASYGAIWAMSRARKPRKEGSFIDAPVDKKLAAAVSARSARAAAELRETCAGLPPKHALAPRFGKIAGLLDAIGSDVRADPKDAQAARSFLDAHADTPAKLAKLVIALESRGASAEQLAPSRARLEKALGLLQAAFERQLARLQDDNLAELDVELEVLEQSLGIDEGFDEELGAAKARPRKG